MQGGTGELDIGTPQLELEVSLDSDQYRVGAPILATVTLTNVGEEPVSIPVPGSETLEFFWRYENRPDPLQLEYVHSPYETASFMNVPPGEAIDRRFILHRATANEGSFLMTVVYRSEAEAGIESAASCSAGPIPVKISPPVLIERDSLGLITEAEAVRVAQATFGPATSHRAAIAVDEAGFHFWWVTLMLAAPDAEGRTTRSCTVNPYLGKVGKEVSEPVPEGGLASDRAKVR